MRLTARLVAWIVGGVIVLLIIDGVLAVTRQDEVHSNDQRNGARQLGGALAVLLKEAWASGGEPRVLELLRDVTLVEGAISVRLVRLQPDSPPELAPRAPLELLDRARAGSEQFIERGTGDGPRELDYYRPLGLRGEPGTALELEQEQSAQKRFRNSTMLRIALISGALLLGGAGLVSLLGYRFVGSPLRQLIEQTRRISAGDLAPSPVPARHDELSDLAVALNEMAARLDAGARAFRAESDRRVAAIEQLRHSDRLKTIGQLMSGIAHELGTPLNVVSGRAGLIESGRLSPGEVAASATTIREQVARMTRIIRQILDFARRSEPRRRETDLRAVAQQAIELIKPLGHVAEARIDPTAASVTAEVDPGQLQQVLINLLVNALQAMPDGGAATVNVTTARRPAPGTDAGTATPVREWALISVTDEGPGIPEAVRKRVFEPFFTTKETGKGTGLGLSIAQGIVHDHGGFIEIADHAGRGARFDVFLPRGRA